MKLKCVYAVIWWVAMRCGECDGVGEWMYDEWDG